MSRTLPPPPLPAPGRAAARPAASQQGGAPAAGDIVIIEDQVSLQMIYSAMVVRAGHAVRTAGTAAEGLRLCREQRPALVLLDLVLPDRDGLDLLARLLAESPGLPVIAVTGNGSVPRAVAAMRAGAHDFLVKPVEESRFLAAIGNALRAGRAATQAAPAASRRPAAPARPADPGSGVGSDGFIGSSAAMRRVEAKLHSVAASMATVFITGESGTGKELAALAVHQRSARAAGPFIALNCGAIPHDLLESEVFGHMKGSFTGAISDKPGAATAADGGTLFLDEVCEMLPALQTKLLRFLQTSTVTPVGATRPRRVDVRIVCATNRDPLDAVRRGAFREDLYYRLYVVPVHMPPLRDRGEDVVEIATAALERFAADEGKHFSGLSDEVRALFRTHGWPGNVRQLLNVIRNVVVLNRGGGPVTCEMLPDGFAPQAAVGRPPGWGQVAGPGTEERDEAAASGGDPFAGLTLAQIERQAVTAALERHGGSVPRAARDLDIAPSTLYRKLDAWGIARG